MNSIVFPDKGDRTLLEYTFYILTTPEGRSLLNSLLYKDESTGQFLEDMKKNPLFEKSGMGGIKDAITYFKDHIITNDMSMVLVALKNAKNNGCKNIDKIFLGNNAWKIGRKLYASIIGFFIGDVLGMTMFGQIYDKRGLVWRNNIIMENYSNLPKISYNSEMLISALELLELNNKIMNNESYNVDKSLDEYIKLNIELRKSGRVQLPIWKNLIENIKNVDNEIHIRKYKSNFKKIFNKPWDTFFDDYIDSEVYTYGGCFGRIIPLALTSGINSLIMDVWITDPYINAFQAMFFMVSSLKMLFLDKDAKEIINNEWNFSEDFSEIYKNRGSVLHVVNTDDIYVLAVHYCYLSLRHNLYEVINLCKNNESNKNFHILFSIIMAFWSAKIGINTMMQDKIIKSNIFKVQKHNDRVNKFFKIHNNYFR